MKKNLFTRVIRRIRKEFGQRFLLGRFPYAYAHFYYWKCTGKELSYAHPYDINQKMFWLARYWQDPRIVQYADKLTVRDYIRELGLDEILTTIYGIYNSADEIDFNTLPSKYVLKTNHCGGGINMVICKENSSLNHEQARRIINEGLKQVVGIPTCEYHYQYIVPKAFAEEYIGDENDERLEVQFFCFNGRAQHILVRNDLGDASKKSFAISYDLGWNRCKDRKNEDLSIGVPRPLELDRMIEIANKLASPFPQVRIDLYYVRGRIYFGEMTFTTSGNILWNYTDDVIKRWGDELVLPQKLKTKWKNVFTSQLKKNE